MAALLLTLLACQLGAGDSSTVTQVQRDPVPEVTLPAPALRRLTVAQYHNTLRDLLGADLVLPTSLEPDQAVDGLLSVGAATTSVSAWGVEKYEDAAFLVAEQVFEDVGRREALTGCTPTLDDTACVQGLLESFGRRAYRRPLTAEETQRLLDLYGSVAAGSGDGWLGTTYVVAALLQSPHFLYRKEQGSPDGAGGAALDGYEVASRLSFLLWNTSPDEELLDAAAAGELLTDAGLVTQAERLMADARFRDGVRNFFTEMLELYLLDGLTKDPTVFAHASDDLGELAREETLLGIQAIVLEDDGDIRDLLVGQRTFVDRSLAAIYNVRASEVEGFGEVWLDPAAGRRGLLGQVSFLALHAHVNSSSATLRGKAVRQALLCQEIPPPPGDVDTSIPEVSEEARTLRERVAAHLENESCASCHLLMDPIGLGLENFDGIGRWRTTENEATIDVTGDLDGEPFADAWELAGLVADHPDYVGCVARQLYQYGMGHGTTGAETPLVKWLADGLVVQGGSVRSLFLDTITSPAFRRAGEVE